jgi:hypothetical protein
MDESHCVLKEADKQSGENGSLTWDLGLLFSRVTIRTYLKALNEGYSLKVRYLVCGMG